MQADQIRQPGERVAGLHRASPRGFERPRAARPRGCVVAVERDARFDCALAGCEDADETVVLTQGTLEAAPEFAERVCHRMTKLELQGHALSDVAVAVGPDVDGHRLQDRYFLAKALIALFMHEPHAEISLVASARSGEGLPHELLSLFELLLADLPGNVSLRLRLRPEEPAEHPSGIFAKIPAPEATLEAS